MEIYQRLKMIEKKRPLVGISVIVINDKKILFGKRKGSHGSGTWAFQGGHLEMYETFEQTAKRELKEETNLDVEILDKNLFAVTNDFFKKEDKHYVTLYLRARTDNPNALKLMDPEKCDEWKWFGLNDFPEPLFISIQNLIKQGFNPFKQI